MRERHKRIVNELNKQLEKWYTVSYISSKSGVLPQNLRNILKFYDCKYTITVVDKLEKLEHYLENDDKIIEKYILVKNKVLDLIYNQGYTWFLIEKEVWYEVPHWYSIRTLANSTQLKLDKKTVEKVEKIYNHYFWNLIDNKEIWEL